MSTPGTYIIVCEGASECNYLDHLNRFLSTLPLPDGGGPIPLRFIARPKNIDPKTGVNVGCGGGDYGKVSRAYRKEWRANRTYPFGIWVDADLYVRNDNGNRELYAHPAGKIPAFDFSILNFEDFIALHYCDELVEKWKTKFSEVGHFRCPLHWEEYKVYYSELFPDYRKNLLPIEFLSVEALRNLFRHMDEMPDVDYNGLRVENTFAGLLKAVLMRSYPAMFASV